MPELIRKKKKMSSFEMIVEQGDYGWGNIRQHIR